MKYDSFIIIHGTDTLTYTASLLSFYLKDWKKSVIVTGSQIPLVEFRNDAVRNIKDSLIMSTYNIPQVLIVFGGVCLRANCSTKYSSVSFVAYKSPNLEILGDFGVNLKLNYKVIQDGEIISNTFIKKNLPLTIKTSNWKNDIYIAVITLVPGINWEIKKKQIFSSKLPNAIILRSFGIGNAPVSSKEFIDFLKLCKKHKIIVVNTTQCYSGGVNMQIYKTGVLMKKHSVLSGEKMTFEAIYTKLFYLFQVIDKKKIEFQMTIIR
jgi:L-asparaginase